MYNRKYHRKSVIIKQETDSFSKQNPLTAVATLELKNGRGKINIKGQASGDNHAYLIAPQKGENKFVDIGQVGSVFNPDDVAGSGMAIEDFDVLVLGRQSPKGDFPWWSYVGYMGKKREWRRNIVTAIREEREKAVEEVVQSENKKLKLAVTGDNTLKIVDDKQKDRHLRLVPNPNERTMQAASVVRTKAGLQIRPLRGRDVEKDKGEIVFKTISKEDLAEGDFHENFKNLVAAFAEEMKTTDKKAEISVLDLRDREKLVVSAKRYKEPQTPVIPGTTSAPMAPTPAAPEMPAVQRATTAPEMPSAPRTTTAPEIPVMTEVPFTVTMPEMPSTTESMEEEIRTNEDMIIDESLETIENQEIIRLEEQSQTENSRLPRRTVVIPTVPSAPGNRTQEVDMTNVEVETNWSNPSRPSRTMPKNSNNKNVFIEYNSTKTYMQKPMTPAVENSNVTTGVSPTEGTGTRLPTGGNESLVVPHHHYEPHQKTVDTRDMDEFCMPKGAVVVDPIDSSINRHMNAQSEGIMPTTSETPMWATTPIRVGTPTAPTMPVRPEISTTPLTPTPPPGTVTTPVTPTTPMRGATPVQAGTPTRATTPAMPVTPSENERQSRIIEIGVMPPDNPQGTLPQGIVPPIGTLPEGIVPPIGTLPEGIVPPIGTLPEGIVPPIGTLPEGIVPPIGTLPEGIVPPIGTLPIEDIPGKSTRFYINSDIVNYITEGQRMEALNQRVWEIFESGAVQTPFNNMNSEWVSVSPQEIWTLPVNHDILRTSFVIYSYLRYNHVLLGRTLDGRLMLGIPDYYDPSFRREAMDLGYTDFVCQAAAQESCRMEGTFGYWVSALR